jgi:hypothetical protein
MRERGTVGNRRRLSEGLGLLLDTGFLLPY